MLGDLLGRGLRKSVFSKVFYRPYMDLRGLLIYKLVSSCLTVPVVGFGRFDWRPSPFCL